MCSRCTRPRTHETPLENVGQSILHAADRQFDEHLVEESAHKQAFGPGRGNPNWYSKAIHRVLRIGGRRPRCLPSALVMFDLLRSEGTFAELVIGLPSNATNQIAHAWVEVDGRDVGPPPGRHEHGEFARYG